jgi:hypothetical protein
MIPPPFPHPLVIFFYLHIYTYDLIMPDARVNLGFVFSPLPQLLHTSRAFLSL